MAVAFVAATEQYLSAAGSITWGTTGTVCFWFRKTTPAIAQQLFDGDAVNAGPNIQIYDSKVYAGVNDGSGGWAIWTTSISADTWYHVAFTWNGTNHELYVDGVSRSNPANAKTPSASGAVIAATHVPGSYLGGQMDDVCVWSSVLTVAQVQSLSNSRRRLAPTIPNLVRWWPLQGPNGAAASGASTVRDYSTNAGHGTPSNSPLYQGSILTWRARPRLVVGPVWSTVASPTTTFSQDAASTAAWSVV